MRFDGERRRMLALALDERDDALADAEVRIAEAAAADVALVLAFADKGDGGSAERVFARLGVTSLGAVPVVVRPLRLSAAFAALGVGIPARASMPDIALLAPFGRTRRAGVREIEAAKEPRVTRLWDRFSIDVVAALERTATYLDATIFAHLPRRAVGPQAQAGHRVFVFEDGDRYVIRALCIFRVAAEAGTVRGYVSELLHDRSLAGMRAASHLLGLALREMSDAGAEIAIAWSPSHSGSYPIYARHGFFHRARVDDRHVGVRAFDSTLAAAVTRRESWYFSLLDAPPAVLELRP